MKKIEKKKFLLLLLVMLFLIPTSLAIYKQTFHKNVVLNIQDSTYTVVFDGNDETSGSTTSKQCKYNTDCQLPANGFQKTGYNFIGWSTNEDGPVEYENEDTVKALTLTGNVTLYAQWSAAGASEYGITYHYGDMEFTGSNYINTDLSLFSQANYNKATHEYKDFEINFTMDSLDSSTGDRGTLVQCEDEADTSNYPGFVYRYRTSGTKLNFVTYIHGSDSSTDFTSGNYPTNVKIERKDDLLYFNNNQVGSSFDNIPQNWTTPLTFGAAFEHGVLTTPYRYFKGELSNITTKLMYDAGQVTLPSPAIVSGQNYVFKEWNTKADGTGTAYSSINLTSDIDLYAIWEIPQHDGYTVTYDYGNLQFNGTNYLNTGLQLFSSNYILNDFDISIGSIANSVHVTGQSDNFNTVFGDMDESGSPWPGVVFRRNASTYSLVANVTTSIKYNKNYTGSSIDLKRQDSILYLNNTQILDLGALSKTFNTPLTFGAGLNGSGNPFRYFSGDLNGVEVALSYDKSSAVTLPTPSMGGTSCTFAGWTGSNGNTPQVNVTIPAGNTQDKNYTANFNCVVYNIDFNANGGTVNESSRSISGGQAIGTLPTPTREGYTFAGWYLNDEFTGSAVDASYVPQGDIDLYAKWNINQYTITFNSDGGDQVTSITADYGTPITAPANPTKSGYRFVRWSPTLPETMPADNITVTAIWRSNDLFAITYNYGNLEFTGSNLLNTGLRLFSNDLVQKDFDISLDVTSNQYLSGQNSNMNSLIAIMDESGQPYPGIVYRRNASEFKVGANANANEKYEEKFTGTSIDLKRESSKLYLNNDEILDFSELARTFNTPLTIGASLNSSGNPFRYSKGTLSNIKVDVIYSAQDSVTLPEPTYSDCVFTGWTGSNGNTPQKNITIPSGSTQDYTYNANFSCTNYTITFNAGDGTVSENTKSIEQGTAIGTLPIPTREGYTFGGWYLNDGFTGSAVDASYVPEDDITLYAKWNVNQYTITFNTAGGNEISSITADYGTAITPPNDPTKEGYTFTGWNPTIPATMPADNITVVAQWQSDSSAEYTITYDYGDLVFDGTNSLDTKLALFSQANYNISSHTYRDFSISFEDANYHIGDNEDRATYLSLQDEDSANYHGFVYRYRTENTKTQFMLYLNKGDNEYQGDFTGTSIPSDVEIRRTDNYLYFNNNKIDRDLDTIFGNINQTLLFGSSYRANQGGLYRKGKSELNNVNVSLEYDNSNAVTLPLPEMSDSNCTFTGWTGSNGNTPQTNVTVPAGNTASKSYTANFNCAVTHTVTFDANEGSVSESTRTVIDEEAIGSLPTPTREGYTFDGWYLESTFETPADASYVPTEDVTLIAKWNINQYTITFNTDGGNQISSITADYGTPITAPSDPTKEGYIFQGWLPTIPATMPATNTTVVAQWQSEDATEYKVTYDYGNLSFSGTSYLNTGLQLFSTNHVLNDFDIALDIGDNEYLTGQNSNMNSLISIMDESGDPYPGLVFRRNQTQFSIAANTTSSIKYSNNNYTNTSIDLKRESKKLKLNGNQVLDFSALASTFDIPLTFGASLNGSGNPFRYFKGDLNNTTVSLNYDNSNSVTLPTPNFVNSDCTFDGWTGSNGNIPQTSVTIPAENTQNKTYTANFTCTTNRVSFNAGGGTVSETTRTVNIGDAVGTLPTPVKGGNIFDGWYLESTFETPVTASYIPQKNVTFYAKWLKSVGSMVISNSDIEITLPGTEQIAITNSSEIAESYTFTSNDTNVATVSSSGLVTGVSEGATTVTIRGQTSNATKTVNVYVSSANGTKIFNITPTAMQNYLANAESWASGTKTEFLTAMQDNFETNNCMLNSDSSVTYASGSVKCDKARGYDTDTNTSLNVYLYDTVNETKGTKVTYTNSNNGVIYNMIPGKTYYWEVANDTTQNGTVKAVATKNRRILDTGVIRNTRDLGGLPVDTNYDGTIDGTLKYGKMFRGERLRTDQSSVDILTSIGATKEILLSSSGEVNGDLQLSQFKLDTIVHYQIDYTNNRNNYNTIRAAMIRAMQDVINGENIYFHCVYGSDRTGTLAYVLEGLLGVPDEERYEDYELSVFFGEVDRNRYFETDIKSTLPKFVYMKGKIPTAQSIYDWFMLGSSDQASDEQLISDFRAAMINQS